MTEFLDASLPAAGLVAVYLAFRLKHFLGDFLLQTRWMVLGKERVDGWAKPLAVHAGVHAFGTTAIALVAAPALWWLGLVDFVLHATIDRAKAMQVSRHCCTPQQGLFWLLLGLDQEAHNLTHFAFVLAIALA